jgi:hypothetical protein
VDRHGGTLVRADLGNGRVIQVEATPSGLTGTGDPETDVGVLDALRGREALSFDGVTEAIEAIASRVTDALTSAKPEKATVEFGVDIGVEAGGLTGLLAKGSATATLKITLEWSGERAAGANG